MPDQSSAATEHAIIQEITAPLATLPDDAVALVSVDFPVVLRGYDRLAVDEYVSKTSQLVAELQTTRSPEAAVRRALERVGEQISGILQRAHEAAGEITSQSRAEAEDRLERSRREAAQITAEAEQRVKDLDVDTDRIWAERHRIVEDTRGLARQLREVAESAAERFPPAEEAMAANAPVEEAPAPFDVEASAAAREDLRADPGAGESQSTEAFSAVDAWVQDDDDSAQSPTGAVPDGESTSDRPPPAAERDSTPEMPSAGERDSTPEMPSVGERDSTSEMPSAMGERESASERPPLTGEGESTLVIPPAAGEGESASEPLQPTGDGESVTETHPATPESKLTPGLTPAAQAAKRRSGM
jgi:hypothetical protein